MEGIAKRAALTALALWIAILPAASYGEEELETPPDQTAVCTETLASPAEPTLLSAPICTPTPTATPIPQPTATPIPEPTPIPPATPIPQPTATPIPSATPIPQPTATPIPEPTPIPTAIPSAIPSLSPSPVPEPTVLPPASSLISYQTGKMPELKYTWDPVNNCWNAAAMPPVEVPVYAVNTSGQALPALAFQVSAASVKDAGGLYVLECRMCPGAASMVIAPDEKQQIAVFVFSCPGGSTVTACEGRLALDMTVDYAKP